MEIRRNRCGIAVQADVPRARVIAPSVGQSSVPHRVIVEGDVEELQEMGDSRSSAGSSSTKRISFRDRSRRV